MGLVKALQEQPYAVLWKFSVLLFTVYIIALFLPETTIDFNIYDTYYVIGTAHFINFLALSFGLFGLGYYVLLKCSVQPIFWLTGTHLAITIMLLFPLCFPNWFNGITKYHPELNFPAGTVKLSVNNLKGIALFMMISAQLIYFINILISIAVKLRSGKG